MVFDFIHTAQDGTGHSCHPQGRNPGKSYIYVDDVLDGIWLARSTARDQYNYFNLSTDDHITVSEIAGIVIETMGLSGDGDIYSGGDRGWKGDVPVSGIQPGRSKLGWRSAFHPRRDSCLRA